MSKLANIGVNVFRGAVIPALNFLVMVSGIRIHGKESWGTLISIIIWVSLMVFVMGWGNKDFLVRKYSSEPSKMYTAFYSSLFSRSILLVLSLVLLIFFPAPIAFWGILLVVLMHFYASLESLVIYHQKFKAQLFSELLGFGIILGGIFGITSFSLLQFIQLYCVSVLIKLIYMFLALKLWKEKPSFEISITQLGYGLPFFILGFSGMVNSKIDLYLVNAFLPSGKISEYQLLTSAFLMLQSLSVLMASPLNKAFYRSGNRTIGKLDRLFKKLAIPLVLMGSTGIWLILEKWMQTGLPILFYLLGLLASLPAFYYVIPVLNLYKKHQEKKVLWSNIFSAVLNTIASLALLPGFGITGVLLSVCVSQWVYLIIIKKYENSTS
jgi:O-antigen/teichoic acid export membrane protein